MSKFPCRCHSKSGRPCLKRASCCSHGERRDSDCRWCPWPSGPCQSAPTGCHATEPGWCGRRHKSCHTRSPSHATAGSATMGFLAPSRVRIPPYPPVCSSANPGPNRSGSGFSISRAVFNTAAASVSFRQTSVSFPDTSTPCASPVASTSIRSKIARLSILRIWPSASR